MAKTKQTNTPETNETEAVETASGPVIEYVGEGADKVKFTVDPKAKLIRVNADGIVHTVY